MITNDDLQYMLDSLKSNSELSTRFNNELENINADDRNAINRVVREGWYEAFDRFDSDVCETFIQIYRLCA